MEFLISVIAIMVCVVFLSTPFFILFKLIGSIYKGQGKIIKKLIKIVNKEWIEVLYMLQIIGLCFLGFVFTFEGVKAGNPIYRYEIGGEVVDGYASLSTEHLPTIAVLLILGILSYFILKLFSEELSPIIYTICSSILIIDIIFTILYFIHTSVHYSIDLEDVGGEIICLRFGLGYLSLLFIAELIVSLGKYLKNQKQKNIKYKNKILRTLYSISLKYQTAPLLWIISSFPILIIIQLILVIFGQQPDSFIKVFLDTSSFNYSAVSAPPPITIAGDSHYLCTVSVKGHKKLVKPVRAGIRRNERILVNRQLLVANAFENILEEYTPRFHKVIRYIYDKYGYPISKHINTAWSADIIYIIMKPLEWWFTLVLYTIDKNPENRINIQYSELRRN